MKKLIIKLGTLLLLCGVVSLQGMFNASRATLVARKRLAQQHTFQINQQPSSSKIIFNSSPFTATQKRGYTAPAEEGRSWWGNFISFFKPEMTSEQYSMHIDKLLNGHIEPLWKAPNGRGFNNKNIFDENDLNKVKQAIDLNKEYIIDYRAKQLGAVFNWSFVSVLDKDQQNMDGTILDKVLCLIFNGDRYDSNDFVASDSTLNYIKLARYLIDQGAAIKPENEAKYVKIYADFLMPRYRELYEPNPSHRHGVQDELEKIKKTFEGLDPLLDKLIFSQALKDALIKLRKERAYIEKNESQFKKEQDDKVNRDEYLRAKAEHEKIKKYHQTQKPDDIEFGFGSIYENLKKQKFDEVEYQAWLKSGKNAGFFYGEHWKDFEFKFRFGKKADDANLDIYSLLNIPQTSSAIEVKRAYYQYMRENHPDYARNESEKKERTIKTAKANDAYDIYKTAMAKEQLNRE